jgi:hypothetical protein
MKLRYLFLIASATALIALPVQASVEISTNPTKDMNCSDGVCAPTNKKAVLNTTDLANMLASGDVKVMTGSGAITITVSSPFSWASTHRLTLDANVSVSFRAPVAVTGQGAVTIITNDGGTGGDLLFFPGANLDFWDTNSGLNINGEDYVLVKSVQGLRKKVEAKPARNYALANSYDASADRTFSPIKSVLAGKFEGLGNAIQNIKIRTGNHGGGLFLGSSGSIRHLNLTGVSISTYSDFDPVGGLAGYNTGLIQFVNISGTMTIGQSYDAAAGLLVGSNGGTVSDSSATGNIDAPGAVNTAVGGLAGSGGYIVNSHASVDIQNSDYTGGLVGHGYMISNSYATGNVSGSVTGGLVGTLEGQVSGSFATGSVHGSEAGGLIGGSSRADPDTKIFDTYSTGAVDGSIAGGLIGGKVSYLQQAYSLGAVSGNQIGGLIGAEATGYGTNASAYWDRDTSGVSNRHQGAGNISNDPGITGLRDGKLKSSLPTDFDPQIWGRKKSINNGYPYLIANPPPQ